MVAYGKASSRSLAQSGASVLAVDGAPRVLEGDWHGDRTVVLEFESVETARAWYESEGYQMALPLRQAAAVCNVVILEGFTMPTPRT